MKNQVWGGKVIRSSVETAEGCGRGLSQSEDRGEAIKKKWVNRRPPKERNLSKALRANGKRKRNVCSGIKSKG